VPHNAPHAHQPGTTVPGRLCSDKYTVQQSSWT